MPEFPVRTITLGIAEPHPILAETIRQAAIILAHARARYAEAGYEVQTVRLSTRPVFDDLADWSPLALLKYARDLQDKLDDVGLSFCSLGSALAARPEFPLARLDCVADLLSSTNALSATVQFATVKDGLRYEAALPTARIIKRLAHETPEGFGNFRFAMLACVESGSPFFPAAYHSGPTSISIGMQGASIIAAALRDHLPDAMGMREIVDPLPITQWVRAALIESASPLVALGQQLVREHGMIFGGIDLSPAPMGDDSIVAAMELSGAGALGLPGTLAVAAALTSALKSTSLPACGYCGLMLPVLEDARLAERWAEGRVNIDQLLLYSTVCGTGLDTIPLPGDIGEKEIAHLLLDVATLALRLQKPLSARLFPAPGKRAGERTTFTSPYLTNTRINP